jgi:hypothetical protein
MVPGLALMIGLGGCALLAAVLLIRRPKLGYLCAASSGVLVMSFEFVQVIVIGSPPGPSRFMQVSYFALGALLAVTAASARVMVEPPPDRATSPDGRRRR